MSLEGAYLGGSNIHLYRFPRQDENVYPQVPHCEGMKLTNFRKDEHVGLINLKVEGGRLKEVRILVLDYVDNLSFASARWRGC